MKASDKLIVKSEAQRICSQIAFNKSFETSVMAIQDIVDSGKIGSEDVLIILQDENVPDSVIKQWFTL